MVIFAPTSGVFAHPFSQALARNWMFLMIVFIKSVVSKRGVIVSLSFGCVLQLEVCGYMRVASIFLPVCGLSYSLDRVFPRAEVCTFNESLVISVTGHVFGIIT